MTFPSLRSLLAYNRERIRRSLTKRLSRLDPECAEARGVRYRLSVIEEDNIPGL